MSKDHLTENDVKVITKQIFNELKDGLLVEIKKELSKQQIYKKQFLRNSELQKVLSISSSGLQNLRSSGELPFTKLKGIIYYDIKEINKLMKKNKIDFNDS